MARIADLLRGATVSMNRWRNGVEDDGPSGAARAAHLHLMCERAAGEIDRLIEALEQFDDPSRFDASVRSLAQAHLARCDDFD